MCIKFAFDAGSEGSNSYHLKINMFEGGFESKFHLKCLDLVIFTSKQSFTLSCSHYSEKFDSLSHQCSQKFVIKLHRFDLNFSHSETREPSLEKAYI